MKLAVCFAAATLLVACAETPTTTAPAAVDYASLPKDCVASHTNLTTGTEEEKTVPCQDSDKNICVYTKFPNGVFTPYAGPCSDNAGQTGCVTIAYVEGYWIPYTDKQGGC